MKPPTENDGVPWFPDCIAPFAATPAHARMHWGYVVIEEVAGAVAEVMCWPWPLADQLGHLFWPEGDRDQLLSATVSLLSLRHDMYEPSGLQRNPRAGDVFAVESGGDGWSEPDAVQAPVNDLEQLFPGTVLDISADAREAAKLAYQGANAAVFDGAEAEDLLISAGRSREQRGPAMSLTITSPARTAETDEPEART